MSALVKIEEDVPIAARDKEPLDRGIDVLEFLLEVPHFDLQMRRPHAKRTDVAFELCNGGRVGVVQHQETVDLEIRESVGGARQVEFRRGAAEFFQEDQR